MLARAQRVTSGADYKRIVRRGRRISAPNTVTYLAAAVGDGPRFGFIVARSVGNAVVRNRVRRRLKSACADLLPLVPTTLDVVIRALPGSASASWSSLSEEVSAAVQTKTMERRAR